MPIKKDEQSLTKQKKLVVDFREISLRGSQVYSGYNFVDYNPDTLVGRKGLEIYSKIREDDQVKAVLTMKKFARLMTPWEIQPASEDAMDVEIAEFVKTNLENLVGTFEDKLLEIYTALDYGFSISEKIWYRIEKGNFIGKIGLKALKTREPFYYKFESDPYGNLRKDGLVYQGPVPYEEQVSNLVPNTITKKTVDHKNLPIEKFVIYSYNKEFNNYYGKSDLRSTYRSWWSKEILITFMNIYMERFGMPTHLAKYPKNMSKPDRALLSEALDKVQAKYSIMIPEGVEIELLAASTGGSTSFQTAIEMHNKFISRSILVPDLMGFNAVQGGGGSYALGKKHFDVFLWILQKLGRDTEESIVGEQIIKQLVDYNYSNVENYPKFKFESITAEGTATRANIIQMGVAGGFINPEEDWIRDYLALPKHDDKYSLGIPAPLPGMEGTVPGQKEMPRGVGGALGVEPKDEGDEDVDTGKETGQEAIDKGEVGVDTGTEWKQKQFDEDEEPEVIVSKAYLDACKQWKFVNYVEKFGGEGSGHWGHEGGEGGEGNPGGSGGGPGAPSGVKDDSSAKHKHGIKNITYIPQGQEDNREQMFQNKRVIDDVTGKFGAEELAGMEQITVSGRDTGAAVKYYPPSGKKGDLSDTIILQQSWGRMSDNQQQITLARELSRRVYDKSGYYLYINFADKKLGARYGAQLLGDRWEKNPLKRHKPILEKGEHAIDQDNREPFIEGYARWKIGLPIPSEIEKLFKEYTPSKEYTKTFPKKPHLIPIDSVIATKGQLDYADGAKIEGLIVSMKRGDEITPITVDKDNNLIDGRHRLLACKEMGLKEIPIQVGESTKKFTKKTGKSLPKDNRFDYKIDFTKMEDDLDEYENETVEALSLVINLQKDALLKTITKKKLVENKDYAGIKSLQLKFVGDFKKEVQNRLVKLFLDSKLEALNEVAEGSDGQITVVTKFAQSAIQLWMPVQPKEAIDFFNRKVTAKVIRRDGVKKLLTLASRKELAYYDAKAFAIAGIERDTILKKAKMILLEGIKNGDPKGAQHALGRMFDEYLVTGELKDNDLITPHRLEVIVRTNFSEAMNAGRKAMVDDPDLDGFIPYVQYKAILDSRVRDSHAAMHNRIYRKDNPIVDKINPPNGYNCFPAGTKVSVFTCKGKQKFKKIEEVTHGDMVYTHLGNSRKVIELHRNSYVGELTEIELVNGKKIRATPNHLIMTKNRGWVAISRLDVDDEIDTKQSIGVRKQWQGEAGERKRKLIRNTVAKNMLNPIYRKNKSDSVKKQWVGEKGRIRKIKWGKMISIRNKTRSKEEHPMYGRKRTEKEKKNISLGTIHAMKRTDVVEKHQKAMIRIKKMGLHKGKNNHMYGRSPGHGKWFDFYNPKQGWLRLRSSYELITAKYLVAKQIKFLYESKRFVLDNKTFLPDFYIVDKDKFIEVKGWKTDKFKRKWNEMKRLHPDIKIELWDSKYIDALKEEISI